MTRVNYFQSRVYFLFEFQTRVLIPPWDTGSESTQGLLSGSPLPALTGGPFGEQPRKQTPLIAGLAGPFFGTPASPRRRMAPIG